MKSKRGKEKKKSEKKGKRERDGNYKENCEEFGQKKEVVSNKCWAWLNGGDTVV